MPKPILRVIFDRSAFHGDHGDALIDSPLLTLCRRRRVSVLHTPIFLDETLATYRAGKGGSDWRRHLAFAVGICNGGIFLDRHEVWRNELLAGRGTFARYLIPDRPTRRYGRTQASLMGHLRDVAESGDLSKEWDDTRGEREETRRKKKNQRAIGRGMREEVATALKSGNVVGSPKDLDFAEMKRQKFLWTGRSLMDLVDKSMATRLADQWARAPERYPFYTAWTEGFLYNGYYAAVEHNEPLDENAQPDYEQLAHLIWADVIVSNEGGFFTRAFETMWKPRGKRLESTRSFVALVERLT